MDAHILQNSIQDSHVHLCAFISNSHAKSNLHVALNLKNSCSTAATSIILSDSQIQLMLSPFPKKIGIFIHIYLHNLAWASSGIQAQYLYLHVIVPCTKYTIKCITYCMCNNYNKYIQTAVLSTYFAVLSTAGGSFSATALPRSACSLASSKRSS